MKTNTFDKLNKTLLRLNDQLYEKQQIVLKLHNDKIQMALLTNNKKFIYDMQREVDLEQQNAKFEQENKKLHIVLNCQLSESQKCDLIISELENKISFLEHNYNNLKDINEPQVRKLRYDSVDGNDIHHRTIKRQVQTGENDSFFSGK
ncbi:Pleckstrin-like [Hexamita inflata]|uniref:Plant n=1 Tax=Hexamita inflata TaxID=28002 RepID=A0AA86TCB8_9EUKA|nr:Pleckstrin-like [Hexamita inflata]